MPSFISARKSVTTSVCRASALSLILLCGAFVFSACGPVPPTEQAQAQTDKAQPYLMQLADLPAQTQIKIAEVPEEFPAQLEQESFPSADRFYQVKEVSFSGVAEEESVAWAAAVADGQVYIRASDIASLKMERDGFYLAANDIPAFRWDAGNAENGPFPAAEEPEDAAENAGLPLELAGSNAASAWSDAHINAWAIAGAPRAALLKAKAFYLAHASQFHNSNYAVIIDYTKPSGQQRLFLLNLSTGTLERHYVAHGIGKNKGRGPKMPAQFSDRPDSLLTPPGFHLTGSRYASSPAKRAKWGPYALRLIGMEPGKNGHTLARGVVVHGAEYSTPAWVRRNGATGRSWGCPAVSKTIAQGLIHKLEGGALWYHYTGL